MEPSAPIINNDNNNYYSFLTDLQKNVHTLWIGKIYSLSPKVTMYVRDAFLFEMWMWTSEADLGLLTMIFWLGEFLTQANVLKYVG